MGSRLKHVPPTSHRGALPNKWQISSTLWEEKGQPVRSAKTGQSDKLRLAGELSDPEVTSETIPQALGGLGRLEMGT